jgi:hypothetical protein
MQAVAGREAAPLKMHDWQGAKLRAPRMHYLIAERKCTTKRRKCVTYIVSMMLYVTVRFKIGCGTTKLEPDLVSVWCKHIGRWYGRVQ